MISRYDVSLNGISLSSIHPDILVLNISHTPAKATATVNQLANRDGTNLSAMRRDNSSVSITFAVRIYSISKRQQIIEKIQAWALDGGLLETNDRQGQEMTAVCTVLPAISDVMGWTKTLTMTFTAYGWPMWRQKVPATVSLSGSSGSGTLYVPGNYKDALVGATVTPASGTLNDVTLTVGNTSMTITGAAATVSSPLVISYDDQRIQSIKRGNVSLLANRTGSDDLLAACGKITEVSFSASSSCSVTFRAKGVWV